MSPLELAEFMHNIYEKHSSLSGWDTQKRCRVKFKNLPEENKEVMIKVATDVLEELND